MNPTDTFIAPPPVPQPRAETIDGSGAFKYKLRVTNEWAGNPQVPGWIYASVTPGVYKILVQLTDTLGRSVQTLLDHNLAFRPILNIDGAIPGSKKYSPKSGASSAPVTSSAPSSPLKALPGDADVLRPSTHTSVDDAIALSKHQFLQSRHLEGYRHTHLSKAFMPANLVTTAMPIKLPHDHATTIIMQFMPVGHGQLNKVLLFTGQQTRSPTPCLVLTNSNDVVIANTVTPVTHSNFAGINRYRSRSIQKTIFESKQNPSKYLPGPDDAVDLKQQLENEDLRKKMMFHHYPYNVPQETDATISHPWRDSSELPTETEVDALIRRRATLIPTDPDSLKPASVNPDGRPMSYKDQMVACQLRRENIHLNWHVGALYGALAVLFAWELFMSLKLL